MIREENGAGLPYVYRWNRCDRKGERCRVFARGTMNSVGLEFADGFKMVTSGNALRKFKPAPHPQQTGARR